MAVSTDLLEKAIRLLEEGRIQEAKALARQRETREIRDPDFHVKWADICEEIGLVDDAIMELNLAIRDRPDDVSIHRRLAEIHRDNGNLEKAVKRWKKLIEIEPENPEYYRSLGEVFEEMKDYSSASHAYRKGIEKTGDISLKASLRALEFLSYENHDVTEAQTEEEEEWIPSDSQVVCFMDLFSGREGVYARQWISSKGESGYTPIREPFTMGVAKNHIMGNITVGLYPIRMDNTVCFIAFDIDIAKFFFAKAITSKNLWERANSLAHEFACKIVDVGSAHEIPIYIEDSGFKGRHCWIFLETPIPARIARRFTNILLQQVGRPPSELHIEEYPKQSFIPQGGLGNLIKLPLGIHRRSGKRGLFIDGSGKAIPNQLGFLDKIEKASKQKIFEFIQRFHIPEISREETDEKPPWTEGEGEKKRAPLPHIPEEYDIERDQELQYLLSRCPVLLAIVEKINKEGEIDNDERIVLTYSIGLLKYGPEAVNILLGRCTNMDASSFLKSRLRGNPISCPKIRSRVPSITSRVVCNCKFDPKSTLYPTPLIHIQDLEKGGFGPLIGKTLDSLQFQQLLQEYLKAKRQLREIELLMKTYEERLDEFFTQAGVESINTPLGTLKRVVKEGEEKATYQLEI